jgi:thiamine pyrophosphate-dependent acetolactate synthase large subunit-like protein
MRTALRRVDRAFPAERTYVLDGGRNFLNAITLVHAPGPRAYIHTVNFGSIGMGMGHAIGAAFGAPERPVLLVTGDGGFMHEGITEFRTAVRYGLDLTVVVLNDGAYGAEHIQLKNRAIDPAISVFDWPDFGPVATSLGGRGFTARNLAELDDALAKTSARGEPPLLIDVKIDPDRVGGAFH